MQQRTRKGQKIAIEQVEGYLKDTPARLDEERGLALGTLASVKRAKLVQARRERARAEARYGKDDPRVHKADQRMRRQHHQLVNTRAERDRAGAPLVERDDNTWKLHGFVRTREGMPISNATVALYPDRDGHQDALTRVLTDAKGYFSLSYSAQFTATATTGEDARAEPGLLREGGEESGLNVDTKPKRYCIRRAAAAVKQPVFLGAKFGASRVVDARTLYPTPGNVVYRDIELNVEDTDACQLRTRYLGNSNTRELHDLNNEKPDCGIARMRPDNRIYFSSEKQASSMEYDFCAHCFGAERSRR